MTILSDPDAYRYASAIVSVVTLFLLSVAVIACAGALGRAWRTVLWAVVAQQVVLAYVAVVRARSTPPGFPGGNGPASPAGPDFPLVAILVSGVGLLIAVVAALVAHARTAPRE